MNFKNMSVGARLSFGFALGILASMAIAIYGRVQLGHISEQMTMLVNDRMVKVEQVQQIKNNLNVIARSVRNVALLSDEKEMRTEKERVLQVRAENTEIFKKLKESIRTEAGQAALKAVLEASRPSIMATDKAIALGLDNKNEEARDVLLKELRPLQNEYFRTLDELVISQKRQMEDSASQAHDIVTNASAVMLSTAVVAMVLGGFLAWLITRSLRRALGGEPDYAANVAREIAAGNLTVDVNIREGDGGSLLAAMKGMRDSLAQVVFRVRQSSDSVSTASAEIAQGNQDLSIRTESQASALEETAASMEELSSSVKQNADNARQANQLAQSASNVASKGGAVVAEVVGTMKGINDSSKKITDIIGVIDGIAFQTNILALNAAVEAARAGEQGRGFAVVAGEVRNLASRSAEAAKEIKTLINDSVARVVQGTQLVDQAGSTMNEIVTSIQRVSDIMGEISAASTEQSQGVAQVGEAVSQMDQATQQNAALVEEMAAAAMSLQNQAQDLVGAVSVFKLDREMGGNTSGRTVRPSIPVSKSTAKTSPVPSVLTVNATPAFSAAMAGEKAWVAF